MREAVDLGLATVALAARVQNITSASLRGWSERWGLGASCTVDVADDVTSSMPTTVNLLIEQRGDCAALLSWPASFEADLARRLYGVSVAPVPSTIAAASARHLANDLLGVLAEAWLVEGWRKQDPEDDNDSASVAPWQWQALLHVRLKVDDIELQARLPGLRFRIAAPTSTRPLTIQATIAAFANATVPLDVVVGHAQLSLGEVAQLQPGDVLVLDAKLLQPLNLRITSHESLLPVALGTRDGRRAVQMLPRQR